MFLGNPSNEQVFNTEIIRADKHHDYSKIHKTFDKYKEIKKESIDDELEALASMDPPELDGREGTYRLLTTCTQPFDHFW